MSRVARMAYGKNSILFSIRLHLRMAEDALALVKDELSCWDVRHKLMVVSEHVKDLYILSDI